MSNKPWSKEDHQFLHREWQKGVHPRIIAEKLGRSTSAIQARIYEFTHNSRWEDFR